MAGSLRIYRAPTPREVADGARRGRHELEANRLILALGEESVPTKSVDDYVQKVLKLIPVEVIGIYLVGRGVAPDAQAQAGWALMCFVLVFVVRAFLTRGDAPEARGALATSWAELGSVQWGAVSVAAVSFIVWVKASGEPFAYLEDFPHWASVLALLVWSLLAPEFVKGDPVPQGGSPVPVRPDPLPQGGGRVALDGSPSPMSMGPQVQPGPREPVGAPHDPADRVHVTREPQPYDARRRARGGRGGEGPGSDEA